MGITLKGRTWTRKPQSIVLDISIKRVIKRVHSRDETIISLVSLSQWIIWYLANKMGDPNCHEELLAEGCRKLWKREICIYIRHPPHFHSPCSSALNPRPQNPPEKPHCFKSLTVHSSAIGDLLSRLPVSHVDLNSQAKPGTTTKRKLCRAWSAAAATGTRWKFTMKTMTSSWATQTSLPETACLSASLSSFWEWFAPSGFSPSF